LGVRSRDHGRGAGGRRRAHLPRARQAHSQKSAIKPWLEGRWSIPPKQDASFLWRMEDVLEVYTRPYDERFPQVCLDEKSKQLVGEVREPLASVWIGASPTKKRSPRKRVRGKPSATQPRALLSGASPAPMLVSSSSISTLRSWRHHMIQTFRDGILGPR
jgi:hypothetical protein